MLWSFSFFSLHFVNDEHSHIFMLLAEIYLFYTSKNGQHYTIYNCIKKKRYMFVVPLIALLRVISHVRMRKGQKKRRIRQISGNKKKKQMNNNRNDRNHNSNYGKLSVYVKLTCGIRTKV